MKIAFLVFAIVATVLAVSIEQPKLTQPSTSRKALQFNNFTGSSVKQEHITAFINYANTASVLYNDDVEANAKYIKTQMDQQFAVSSQNYFVVIQSDPARFSWDLFILSNSWVATLSGINRINRDWSYLFLQFIVTRTSLEGFSFISVGTKGNGVTAEKESQINSVVNEYESGDYCTCDDYETMNIGYYLIGDQGVYWSTICSATEGLSAYVYTVRGLWIHAKPKNCYYTFYVSQ